MTYPRLVTITWAMALLLACLLAYDMARAGEVYLDAGIGGSLFAPTIGDGTWFNQGLEHHWKRDSISWKLGLTYRINPQWSVGLAYLNMGQTGVDARTTLDDSYYDPMNHKCLQKCDSLGSFKVRDRMQGGELTVSRAFPIGDWSPYVKVGGAVMVHNLQAIIVDNANMSRVTFHGNIPMVVLGSGVEYRPWHLYAETSFYHGLGGDDSGCIGGPCGWPISKQVLVTTFGFRFPLF